MAQLVNMPKEGITVESCLVGVWLKDVGDPVAVDDVLFEYETDKAAFKCMSTTDGVLLHKFYKEGDEVPVLTPVAIVGEAGEDITELITGGGASAETGDGPGEELEEAEQTSADGAGEGAVNEFESAISAEQAVESLNEAPLHEKTGQIKASPRARSLADAQGIELSAVVPTGPEGRILEADVIAALNEVPSEKEPETPVVQEAAAQKAPEAAMEPPAAQEGEAQAAPESLYVDEQYSKIRAVIGKTMLASLQRSAQLTNHHSFDATNVLNMREEFKASDEALGYSGVSVGDVILYVTSRVLARHPEINALVAETGMRKYLTVNLGFAVDTPRGLLVPTIFGAEKKSLREISRDVKALAEAAKEGRISPDCLKGGTFTVSNLGATGVEVFTPIINPPQAAIAGISGIVERVRKGKNGRVEVYPSIGISLTYDHRAVDGAPASRFAAELCEEMAAFSWKTLALEYENEKHL